MDVCIDTYENCCVHIYSRRYRMKDYIMSVSEVNAALQRNSYDLFTLRSFFLSDFIPHKLQCVK